VRSAASVGGRPEVSGDGRLVWDLERPRDVSRDEFTSPRSLFDYLAVTKNLAERPAMRAVA
jgi:hypothetical protein